MVEDTVSWFDLQGDAVILIGGTAQESFTVIGIRNASEQLLYHVCQIID
jgi:hypothetical protein